jgi:H+-transporting ATPase
MARHFWAPVPWMLEATIVLQIIIGKYIEALMIGALLIFNAALSVLQENRAEAALALLEQRLSLKARVKRDSRWVELPAAVLVPGDVVQLSVGVVVPGDVRIIEGSGMPEVPHLSTPHVFVEWAAGQLRIKRPYSGERCVRGLCGP